jgi:hypothetical protein
MGELRTWRSPDRTTAEIFLRVGLHDELDARPGVVILTPAHHSSARAFAVANLRKELPALRAAEPESVIAYWKKDEKATALLNKLTKFPVFADRIGPGA